MMCTDSMLALAPVTGIVTDAVVFMVAMRVVRQEGKAMLWGIAAGLAVTVFYLVNIPASLADGIMAVLSYIALAFCFWTGVNFNCVSLRMRVLRELLHAPGHVLSASQLAEVYRPEEVVSRRLARLEKYGHLTHVDGRFFVQKQLLLHIAGTIEWIRRFIIPVRNHDQN